VGKASSSKKVARASKAGGRAKVRSQQGRLFPIVLGVVLVLGVSLLVYGRSQTQSASAATPPRAGLDHWHSAYGFYTCDKFQPPITDTTDPLGIHTHGDGLIHIHPSSSQSSGKNATLGVFFDAVGVKMSDTKLELPGGQGTYENGKDCNGKPANLRVAVWKDLNGDPQIYTADFNNIRFTQDLTAITIAWVPDDATIPQPPDAKKKLDSVTGKPDEPITVPGATTVPGETTVPGATTLPSSATTAAPAGSTTSAG
jgi:hypothetical protein